MTAIPVPTDHVAASKAELIAWLHDAGTPGQAAFRASARAAVAATLAVVLGWAAVAIAVGSSTRPGTGRRWLFAALVVLAGATALRAVAQHVSRRMARRGRDAVTRALRRSVLATALPEVSGTPRVRGERAAHASIELIDQVAGYHERTQPARRAVVASSGLVLAVIAALHWPVAVILALSTPILPANTRLAAMATDDASRRQLDEVRRLSHQLLDRFRGMRTLVSLGAVERERGVVEQASDRLNRATNAVLRRAFIASGVLDAVVTFAIAVCATYVGLVLLGYVHLGWAPGLGFVAGLLVLVLCPVYFAPLREHAAGYHERDEALAAAAILVALIPPRPAAADDRSRHGGALPAAPVIELDRVTVAFAGTHPPAIEGISVRLPAGTLTVLAGPSGEGKTTLLRLIAGLRAPSAGTVVLRDPATGRARPPGPGQASWIGQQTVLLPGTLAYNIGLADPAASRAAIARAASRAGLDPVTAALPDGLDSEVGEQGWGVSAGQARRVALARALLRDAPLWLLDEPTAHLDADTERDLLDSLLSAAAGRTVVIASHSAALADRAEVLWRLDRGRLSAELTMGRA
jgi:ATP-binding cassette subfamily C protein CydD